MFGMPILVCALRAEAEPAQLRYASLFRFARPTQTGTVGQWRWESRRRLPTLCCAALRPFTRGISTSFAAL